jgi:DNA polymerase III delta subunit
MKNYQPRKYTRKTGYTSSSSYVPYTAHLNKIRSGIIEPVYILFGQEHPGKNEFIAELKTTDDYKIEEFAMPDTIAMVSETVNNFLSKVFTPSLWGDKLLLIIYDFQNIPTKTQKEILERLAKIPKDYFARIVVECKYSKALQELFAKYGLTLINFYQPEQSVFIQHICEMAKSMGLVIDTESVKTLIDLIGVDFATINQELEKIKTYLGTKTRITQDIVLYACGMTRESSVEDLVQSAYNRDTKQSITDLFRLHNDYVAPVMIVGYLANAGFQILQIALGASKNSAGFERIGQKRFDAMLRQSRNWQARELGGFLLELSKIDKKIKTGYPEPYVLLESLLIKSGKN